MKKTKNKYLKCGFVGYSLNRKLKKIKYICI